MPQKITPNKVVVTSQDGGDITLHIEHKIELELTIHLDGDAIKVSHKAEVKEKKQETGNSDYLIPSFDTSTINFGKEVKLNG